MHISEILSRICPCGSPATVSYQARGTGEYRYRAVQACDRCAPSARKWAARAGPVQETRLAPEREEIDGLF